MLSILNLFQSNILFLFDYSFITPDYSPGFFLTYIYEFALTLACPISSMRMCLNPLGSTLKY